jgi:archaellum component FlaC
MMCAEFLVIWPQVALWSGSGVAFKYSRPGISFDMNATEPVNIREKIARCNKKETPEERQDCINQIIVESIETLDRRAEETGNDTKLILASMNSFQNNFRDALQNTRDEMRNTRETITIDINRLENKVDDRFNKVDDRFNKNDIEISQVKSWIGNINERLIKMEPKIDVLEKTIKEHFSRRAPEEMHG